MNDIGINTGQSLTVGDNFKVFYILQCIRTEVIPNHWPLLLNTRIHYNCVVSDSDTQHIVYLFLMHEMPFF